MTRFILAALILIFFAGCGSVPTNEASISKQITVEYDKFKNQTWIKTPLYLSRQGFTDTFPVKIMLRSLYKDGILSFNQLYVTKMDVSWGFYHSAFGEDGHEFKFTKIDSNVDASGGMVTTSEHFVLDIDKSYLNKMASKDWTIKAYGKKNEGVFIVPKVFTEAFVSKLVCFEEKSC